MTRKVFAVSLMLLVAGLLAFAQEKQAAKPLKLTGYLMDNMCASSQAGDEDALHETAKGHPVTCTLMPSCAEGGFALVVDKKIYKLDEAGNKAALEVLKATDPTDLFGNNIFEKDAAAPAPRRYSLRPGRRGTG